jgi:hypothetical protein
MQNINKKSQQHSFPIERKDYDGGEENRKIYPERQKDNGEKDYCG